MPEVVMAQHIPRVAASVLHLPEERRQRQIVLGSEEWFSWLSEPEHGSFDLQHPLGNLTVRKERRQRGGEYWTAYRRVGKRLRKVYLGKSSELTLARLQRAAITLAIDDETFPPPIPAHPLPIQSGEQKYEPVLLTTKLASPLPRSRLVLRPRLTNWITGHLHMPVLLITAPAGFGKTTLLAEWRASAQSQNRSFAWLSLDETDNDPAQFWAYVVAALQTVWPDLPFDALAPLRSPHLASLRVVVATLINALASVSGESILVLDDYHVITSPVLHESLSFLLEHLPPQLHLMISSRSTPPLPLDRLRARGHLATLDAGALRCTAREAEDFLHTVMGLRLPTETVAVLTERTEGWLAGLQLAALALTSNQESAGALTNLVSNWQYIEPYLVAEVLQRQPQEVQQFLLDTAILDELTAPLCDAMTGKTHGQQMLKQLVQANLFVVPLDTEGRWYRYHHLFADVLRAHLHQVAPERVSQLYQRASAWYAQGGRMLDAVRYALAGNSMELAAHLIEQMALPMIWERGEVTTVHGWLQALPQEILLASPALISAYAYTAILSRQMNTVKQLEPYLQRVAEASYTSPQLQGGLAFIRSEIARLQGDIPNCVALAKKALNYLPQEALGWRAAVTIALGRALRDQGKLADALSIYESAVTLSKRAGNRFTATLSLGLMANIHIDAGELRLAAQCCQEAIRYAGGNEHEAAAPYAAISYHLLAEIFYEWNDLEQAQRYGEEGIRLCQRVGDNGQTILIQDLLMRLHLARGERKAAYAAFRASQEMEFESLTLRTWQVTVAAWWHLLNNNVEAASLWSPSVYAGRKERPGKRKRAAVLQEYECLTQVWLRVAQGRFQEAIEQATTLRARAEADGKLRMVIELQALESLAWQGQGQSDRAFENLEQVLARAQPEGFIRLLVDKGPPMAALLRRALSHGIAPQYVQRLLEACRFAGTHAALTRQEQKVLRLLASGYSNQAIAQQLVVAPSTVKTHLQHIYQKLDVQNRTQALTKAHDLSLL
jgi:LuxR family maltose regulon positive regulatory protein